MASIALGCASAAGWAAGYTDPGLLDVPWGNYSFTRQGWRGYLETVPARRYRDGLGIVWGTSAPGRSADETAATLAWAGFKRVRLEIPWGSVRWDERGLDEASAQRTLEILRALKAHGLRPLILLNANHLQPCPVKWREWVVRRSAPAGARTLIVSGEVSDLTDSSTATVMSFATGAAAGPLLTDHSPDPPSGADAYRIDLSKPLGAPVAAGEKLRVGQLRYPPFYPVGTPQFETTASGWLRYVELVSNLVESTYGSDQYDIEIWNELTFGSAYLDINNYRAPSPVPEAPNILRPGGSCWELARRTVELLKRKHPNVEVIWGFSNTTFFHTPIPQLPAQIDGQSYHPYGTGTRCFADLVRGRREQLLDSYVPSGCAVQPEGYAHAWQQTESLLRLIAPAARAAHPPDTTTFQHWMTEHGLAPAEIGIRAPGEAERAKEGFLLRAPVLWINKGVHALYVYDLYERDESSFGLLRSDGSISPALQALHRMSAEFAGPETVDVRRQLSLEIAREGGQVGILPGDPEGKYLSQEQAVALLPFQVAAHRLVVAAYVMSQDFPKPLTPQPYRILISGVDGRRATVRYYSPAADTELPVTIRARDEVALTVQLGITEIPNLLEIDESPDARRGEH